MRIRKKDVSSVRKNINRESKSNALIYAGIISYIICLGLRIPLCRVIGDEGVGLFAAAFEIFMLVTILFSQGISRTMSGMIRYRIKRDQYRSAQKVFKSAFKLAVIIAVVCAALLVAGSGVISETLILEPMSRKAVYMIAPAIIFSAFLNVFRGYFSGIRLGLIAVHSQYIEKALMLIFAALGGSLMYDYGLKVKALLKFDMAAYAYAAMGAAAGIVVAQLFAVIYMLIMYAIYSGTWKSHLAQDGTKRVDGKVMGSLFAGSMPIALIMLVCNSLILIDQRFFNYCVNVLDAGAERTGMWGAFYGKTAVLIGICAALACLALCTHAGRITDAYEKEEYRMMRDRIGSAVKSLFVIAVPLSVFVAVMSDALVNAVYPGDNAETAELIKRGCFIIFFYAAAYLFGQLMLKMNMAKEFLISLTAAFALHIAALVVLVRVRLMGAEGIIYSLIIFTAALAILCFIFMSRQLKYRQEWLYSCLFPVLAACISGLVAMLVKKLMPVAAGSVLTILVSAVVAYILYILLLIILRVAAEEELMKLPLGSLWISLGRMIGVM